MSLFQCEVCGCCENTALSWQGFRMFSDELDWNYAPEREGKLLCSACGPKHFKNGEPTNCGRWHDKFERVFLPLGMFVTNCRGNLAHAETGDENYRAYALEVSNV